MHKLLYIFLLIGFSQQAKELPKEFTLATAEIPPYVTVSQNKQIEGLFIDKLNEFQKNTKIKIHIFVMPWARAVNEVKKGKMDAILPALWSKERSEYMAYPTLPFFTFSQSVLIKRVEDNFTFTNLHTINAQKIIGKTRSMLLDQDFDKLVKQGKLSIYETNKLEQALFMMLQGKVDLVASDGDIALSAIKQLRLENRFILLPMHEVSPPSFMAFSRPFAEKHDINQFMSMIVAGH
ncbi:transporter substrate-binding domain-containing protein [uncultured Paraglaciecola sp.]|uniref:substrate-binding periplasmic protein n=1 Tax=uncultured Paraglaciecola sp. TaxID=1765024 RepID=UPI0030D9E616|tara:strand:- start:177498 stop:178205 length:708 start_codon:yes stop_codon:yes gene_type:complete